MAEIIQQKFVLKKGETLIVRTALPSDAKNIIQYVRTIFRESPFMLTTEPEFTMTVEKEKQFLQDCLKSEGKLALVAEVDNRIIGFLNFQNGNKRKIRHTGEFGMSVAQEYRNLGVGSALLKILLNWAEDNPIIEKVYLEVFAKNTAAIALYKKMGFIEEGCKVKGVKIDQQTYDDILLMAQFVEKGTT